MMIIIYMISVIEVAVEEVFGWHWDPATIMCSEQ